MMNEEEFEHYWSKPVEPSSLSDAADKWKNTISAAAGINAGSITAQTIATPVIMPVIRSIDRPVKEINFDSLKNSFKAVLTVLENVNQLEGILSLIDEEELGVRVSDIRDDWEKLKSSNIEDKSIDDEIRDIFEASYFNDLY